VVEFDHFAHVQSQCVSGHVRHRTKACPVLIQAKSPQLECQRIAT
jgi:hypothetical protein